MKTSELVRVVEENGFDFIKGTENIYVCTISDWLISINKENCISINEKRALNTQKSRNVMKAIIEYVETPIEKREEVKKYYFELCDGIDKNEDDRYLTVDVHDGVFFLYKYKRIFTENEINSFPKEIKGAIECGFLKKVEVENA